MRRIVASIDIGTNEIKIVVGEIKKNNLKILASSETQTEGLKKGLIVDSELVISSLKKGLKRIEDLLNLKIKKAICSVSSVGVQFAIGEGSTTVASVDKVVKNADMIMAIQGSVYNKIPSSMELVTVIPTIFRLGEDKIVKDPKGHIATKLTVKTVIVMVPKKNVYSVLKVMEACEIKVLDISINGISDYYTNKNKKNEELVGAVVNLGHETTTVSILNKGVLTNTEVIPLGASNIDNDLSFMYKVNLSDAKSLRYNLALCHSRLADATEVATISNELGEKIVVNQLEASEIMMSRLGEILELVKKQINLLTKKEKSYIIFSGGLSEAKDFNLLLESLYGKSASINNVLELGVRHNKYSTSVGMIKYFSECLDLKGKDFCIWNTEELEELSSVGRLNVAENGVLGKIFGYFFDN